MNTHTFGNIKFLLLGAALVLSGMISAFAATAPAASQAPAGFLTRQGSRLILDGKEFRAISFNKYDLFEQSALREAIAPGKGEFGFAEEALRELHEHGFTIIRTNVSPYWSGTWKQVWLDDDPQTQAEKRKKYFEQLDKVLDLCDKYQVKIIASLCWYVANLGDLGHTNLRLAMTNPNNAGRKIVEEYMREVVTRYKDRPTIAMWELGNEWNLDADIQLPDGPVGKGGLELTSQPVVRDASNNYTSDNLAACTRQMALMIRSIDPHHLITSGHSSPRPSAMHLLLAARSKKTADWSPDTQQQIEQMLRLLHPDPIDVISIHFYNEAVTAFGKRKEDPSNIVVYQRLAEKIGKPLLIGEIGPYSGMKKQYTDPAVIEMVRGQLQQ
ncbi:MAG: cellulase family glycosylhydrolase, partial [Phycisphaerae bacterium]|nr:cellulase family glycosylhydrolase [Phycisphaerae bacterium]